MANRRYELDELLIRPGSYFNPQTEVMVIIDDSPSIDTEIFNLEEFEGADWVLISDDLPVDDARRDELLEEFQATFHGADARDPGSPDMVEVGDSGELDTDEDEDGPGVDTADAGPGDADSA